MPEENPQQLEQAFEAAMRGIISGAASLPTPVRFTRLEGLVNRYGGKIAADKVLSRPNPGDGFVNLLLTGRQNLVYSVEYLVLQDPWSSLFSDEQKAIARLRLA
ncbi:hypothetical protein [Kerstersia gyiorum]|uniref:hypothetical protein n=1 Tax=Kerstersia gyiorum TaxID=206506 RepID=UPI0030D4042B